MQVRHAERKGKGIGERDLFVSAPPLAKSGGRSRSTCGGERTLRWSKGARAKLPSVSNNLISVRLDCVRSKSSASPLTWARTLGSGRDERELKKCAPPVGKTGQLASTSHGRL